MAETKEMKSVVVITDVEPVVNDSSAGLAQMYADLTPFAIRLRGAATGLLFFSILFLGSIEGLFGFMAAVGVLCCAAPGALGTAHAAKCTRILATIAATFALIHILCMATFSLVVMPEMPKAFHKQCTEQEKQQIEVVGVSQVYLADGEEGDAIVATQDDVQPQYSATSATYVAHFATHAARRLQDIAPAASTDEAACARAERVFAETVPTFLFFAIFMELGIFLTAMSTAKAAGRIIAAARRFGANGM